jgi:Fe-S-cluster containining protein
MARYERMYRDRGDEWWGSGVNFTCLPNCGKCCDQPDGIVYLSEEDADRIAAHHGIPTAEWLANDCRRTHDGRWVLESNPEDGKCIYLNDDKTCRIYEKKPAQCSAFPFWRENMVSDRSWRKTKAICPGIDHPEAIVIDGDTIRFHLEADLHAERGFRTN